MIDSESGDELIFYLEGITKLIEGRNKKQFPLKIGISLPIQSTLKIQN